MPDQFDDIDKLLWPRGKPKELGGAAPAQRETAPTQSTTSGSDDPSSWTDPTPAIKGAAGGLERIAEMIPGVQGSRPAEAVRNWAESGREQEGAVLGPIKRFAGEGLPWLFAPELGLGRIAGTAGRIAEHAAAGATQGAADNPEHRVLGSIAGGLGGALTPSLSALARTRPVQHILNRHLRHVAGGAAASAVYPWLGALGFWAYPAVAHGPIGTGINRIGHHIVDKTGKVVGFIPERVARALSAALGGAASSAFAPFTDSGVSNDLFPDTPPARTPNGQENRQNPSVQSQEE